MFGKAALPERFFISVLRITLLSEPMKPRRRRKPRKAYFSLYTSFSFAVTLVDSFAILQRAAMKAE